LTGAELLRRLRRIAHRRGVRLEVVTERGKGSYVTLYFGDRLTILKDRTKEMSPSLLHAVLAQLGLWRRDILSP
jgi:mRNA interferase HicA